MADTSLKVGEQAKRRLRAILLDLIERSAKSGKALRVLEAQMEQDPLGTMERLNKLLPEDPKETAAAPALSINLAFLSAAKHVSARPPLEAIEAPVIEHRDDVEW